MKTSKGFTLIELLVVIAIIGTLASIVLASLNTARNKGADAAAKSAMGQLRSQAEMYYDDNKAYDGVCGYGKFVNIIGSVNESSSENVICNANTDAWAASAVLKGGDIWCVDSTGGSSVRATEGLGSSDYDCASYNASIPAQ